MRFKNSHCVHEHEATAHHWSASTSHLCRHGNCATAILGILAVRRHSCNWKQQEYKRGALECSQIFPPSSTTTRVTSYHTKNNCSTCLNTSGASSSEHAHGETLNRAYGNAHVIYNNLFLLWWNPNLAKTTGLLKLGGTPTSWAREVKEAFRLMVAMQPCFFKEDHFCKYYPWC